MSVPVTPVIPEDFSPEWARFVLKDWFVKNEKDEDQVQITKVDAQIHGQQVGRCFCRVFYKFHNIFLSFLHFPIIELRELNPHFLKENLIAFTKSRIAPLNQTIGIQKVKSLILNHQQNLSVTH